MGQKEQEGGGQIETRGKWKRLPGAAAAVYMCLVLTVFLFYFDGNGYGRIMEAKARAFFCLCGGYVLLMALWGGVSLLRGGWKGLKLSALLRKTSWPQRAVLLYVAITWASALCSPFWPATFLGASRFEGALSITLYGASFLLVSAYGRAGKWLLAVLGASLCGFGVVCLLQLYGRNPFGLYPAGYTYQDGGRAYLGAYLGTIGNVDLVAAFYSLCIPMLIYALVRLKGKARFLLLVPLGLSLWVLVWMDVSAGLVGVLGGCTLAVPLAGITQPKKRRAAALLLGGLVLLGLAVLYFADFGSGMLHEAHCLLRGQADPGFGSGRLHIWREVLEKVPEHPWLGAGPDTMLYGGLEPFQRYDSQMGRTIVAQIDAAHNEYLNILYHQGVFALGAFLALLALLARRWAVLAPSSAGAAMVGAGCLGYCIQAFFGIAMCTTELFFWTALALLAAGAPQPDKPFVPDGRTETLAPGRYSF